MSEGILGNATGGFGMPRSFVIADENGNELTGVVTDSVQVFDATPADVRVNKTFASANGVQIGENTITYRTSEGSEFIFPECNFSIPLEMDDQYDYTKLQCIITKYTSDVNERMAAEKIVLNNNVYEVNSSVVLSTVTKNTETKSIDLNIVNNTNDIFIIYFFTYTEEEI